MKKYCILLLLVCFLLPSAIFASSEGLVFNNAPQQSEILSIENQELVAYLRENVSSGEDVTPAIEAFYAEHPEYVESAAFIERSVHKDPQKIKTVEIYSEKEITDDQKERGLEVSLIFYDDDSFIVEQFSYEGDGILSE